MKETLQELPLSHWHNWLYTELHRQPLHKFLKDNPAIIKVLLAFKELLDAYMTEVELAKYLQEDK